MRKVYYPLSTDCLHVETEGSFLAASGVAEKAIDPINVEVKAFDEVETVTVDFGNIDFK